MQRLGSRLISGESLRPAARLVVRRVAYWVVALTALLWRRGKHSRARSPLNSILVIRLDLLGDVLFSRQAVQGLRFAYPGARIVMLTLPYTAALARTFPEIDNVVTVDTNRIRRPSGLVSPATWIGYLRAVTDLRRESFDVAISLSGPMASLWAALSGAEHTIGYADEAYPRMLTDAVPGGRYRERKHEVEYCRELARAAGAESFPPRLAVPLNSRAEQRVDTLLARAGLVDGDALVLIHAGSVNGSAKRWPPSHWAQFADGLHTRGAARVALIGARSDLPIAREVLESASTPVVSLVGDTSIDELTAIISRADLIATGDSGPLHLAVALGKPLVAVYGPTDPMVHGPFNPLGPVALHRRDLPCSPCYSMAMAAECPLGDPICMRLVTVEPMLESALRLLESRRRVSPTRSEHELLVPEQNALQDAE